MRHMSDDLKDINIFLFIPFVADKENYKIKDAEKDEYSINYLEALKKATKTEFNEPFSEKMERFYLGTEKFIVDDRFEKDCHIFLTRYNFFYIATIAFYPVDFEPTNILTQASINKLSINRDGENTLCKYFDKYHGLKLSPAGGARCFTSLTEKPIYEHLAYIMACEPYKTKGHVNTPIIARYFYDKLHRNLANYESDQIFASGKNVVCIFTDTKKTRLEHESLVIFILELITLQLCVINANYVKIMDELEETNYSQEIVENVNGWYSSAAKLWNIENYKFLTAKRLAKDIAKEFGLPLLKKEYNANLEIYEKLTTMESQKAIERNSRNIQILILIFTILSGISAIIGIIEYIN